METLGLMATIIFTAMGATWVLSRDLSSIQGAIKALVVRVDNHDAEIINLKKRRTRRKPPCSRTSHSPSR